MTENGLRVSPAPAGDAELRWLRDEDVDQRPETVVDMHLGMRAGG